MKKITGVLPFIILSIYFTLGNMTGFHIPAMRALSVAGLMLMTIALYLRKRISGLSAIDRGILIFMALSTAVFLFFPQGPAEVIAEFNIGLFYLVLFAVSALPALILKRHFTEYYARKTTPEAVWETDIFKTINRHLTWAWVAIFAISAFMTIIPALFFPAGGTLAGLLFQVGLPTLLMVGIGIPLNKMYPRYYQRKLGLDSLGTAEGGHSVGSALTEKTTNKPKQEEKMTDQLRVVAINGSPHGAIGNTSQMIRMIGEGLSREGIVLEEILLTDKAIAYCIGCAVCLEKGKCWRKDDHAGITDALFAADGIILASPVYFKHVTAQMKAFIDRSLAFGHKPRGATKPGLAVTVSAGLADTSTAHYIEGMLRIYGAFSLGALVAIGTGPGGFLGKEAVEVRAQDLARELAGAIKEKKRYPVTGDDLHAYLFMRDLVTREKDFMCDDYLYWQNAGILDGFEAYANQRFTPAAYDPEMRKEWIRGLIKEEKAGKTGEKAMSASPTHPAGPAAASSCYELLKMMPLGFRGEAVPGLNAVYQFEISGSETFSAYLRIADDRCTFHEGSHEKPDVLIRAPAEVWLAISQGALDGQGAFMSGKYRVEGNVGLLLKLKTLFPA
ncbi:MAG: NAD(P)H-dependent oxidoreductase [Proteobacteria bacterium]|nr:NAD(P)H-dependent oxidoreductase [Pseudomonadota bacterium]